MKKVLLTLALLGTIGAANAQFEVNAGVTSSDVKVSSSHVDIDDQNGDARIGFNVGVAYNINIGETLFVKPELSFSQLGNRVNDAYSYEGNGWSESEDEILKLDAFSVGTLVGANLGGVKLFSGIQADFLTNPRIQYDYTYTEDGYTESGSDVEKLDEGINKTLLTVPVGIEVKISDKFSVNGRYNIGLSNLIDVDGLENSDLKMTVSSIQVKAIYKF